MAEAVRLEITVDDKGSPVIKAVSDKLEGLGKSAGTAAGGQLKLNDAATRGTAVLGDFGIATGSVVSRVASAIGPIGLLTATVGTSLAAAAHASITAFRDLAAQTRDLAFVSGGSTQQVSGLIDVLGDYGVEASTVERAMVFLSKAVQEGSPALNQLGVSIRTSSGQLKTAHTLFYEVIDALGKMRSETERNLIGQELFSKQWIQMIPAVQQGAEALKKAAEESKLTMSPEDLRRADEYRKAITDLGDQFERLKMTVGRGVILPVTFAIQWLSDVGDVANALARPHAGVRIDAAERERILEQIDPMGRLRAGMPDRQSGDVGAWRMGGEGATQFPYTPPAGETKGEREARLKSEEAARKAKEEANKRNIYFFDLELKAQEKLEKERGEFAVWDSKTQQESIKAEEEKTERLVKLETDAIAQMEKDRAEFLIWDTDQTKAKAETNAKIEQEQNEAFIKYWVARIEQQQALDDQAAKDEVERLQKLAQEREKRWRNSFGNIRGITEDAFTGMNRAFSTSMSGVILGTQTVEDAFRRMGENVVIGLVDSIVNRGLRVVQESLLDFVFGSSPGGGGGGGGISIGGIGSLVSSVADIGGGIVDWVGTFLGSFAGGQWAVPAGKSTGSSTGSRWAPKGDATAAGWAILHPGEMVLPPEIAELVRIALAQRGIQSLEELQARAGGGRGGPSSLGGQYGALSGAERSTLSSIGAYGKAFGIGAGLLGGLFGSLGLAALGPVGAFGVKSIGAVLGIDALMSALGIDSPIGYVGPTEADFQSIRDYAGVFAEAQAREQAALEAAVTESMRGETSPTAQGVLDAIEAGFRSEFDAMEAAAREAAREAAEGEAGGGQSGDPGGEGPSGGPGSGESSGMGSETTGMASGGLFRTRGRLRMTVGEAGSETVAVLRNPRDVALAAGQGGSGAPVTINLYNSGVIGNQLPDNLMREIQRELVRRESRLLRY